MPPKTITNASPMSRAGLQRQCACGQPAYGGIECEDCRQAASGLVQRAAVGDTTAAVPPIVHQVLRSYGRPIDPAARSIMEPRFGKDFSRVRVHTDARAAESAAAIQAKAYTLGEHVVFGAGRYQPGSREGQGLLAHELMHVLQQSQRVAARGPLQIGPAGSALEAQAAAAENSVSLRVQPAAAASTIQRDVLPVSRFSPAPGLYVDRTEQSVSITGAMELYGPEATAARAASIQNSINSTWTRSFPDGYTVTCSIRVTYRGPGSSPGAATQIEAVNISGPSHVTSGPGARTMTLNANEADAFNWTAAHEFGHIIGLDDRYSESIVSSIRGHFGGQRTNTVHAGYESNLMAVHGGALESQNVRDIAVENEPSPYWINDDDQVRDWVTSHNLSDIGRLSTANKLTAIRTLMGGWISDEDVSAITRICASVTTRAEANAIRSGIDPVDFTSIGQRTTVRLAFSRMP